MPIIGMTDERSFNLNRAMPRIGKLYKGTPKQERKGKNGTYEIFGKDLDFFRLELDPKFEDLRDQFVALYGDQPREFPEIQFIGDDVDTAFETWHEEYDAAQTLLHRCDGEVQHLHYNKTTGIHGTAKIACRQNTGEGCDKCQMVGRLRVVLVDFTYQTGVFGYFQIETHSKHDIINLYNALRLMQQRFKTLLGIPFVLGRADRTISTPMKKTGEIKRGKTTKSLLYIRPVANFVKDVLLQAPTPQQMLTSRTTRVLDDKGRPPGVYLSDGIKDDEPEINIVDEPEPEPVETDDTPKPEAPEATPNPEKKPLPEFAKVARRGKVFDALKDIMQPEEIVELSEKLGIDWGNPEKGYSETIIQKIREANSSPLQSTGTEG